MRYFEEVPTINYPFIGKIAGSDDNKVTTVLTVDLMIRFRIKADVLASPLSYYIYEWKENDRPDTVARKYYGDANLSWLVMMSNGAFDALYDFPLPYHQFLSYIESRYGSIAAADATIHHYEDGDGDVIDEDTYTTSVDTEKRAVSALKYEEEVNEDKRRVKLLSRQYLPDVLREYEQMLKRIKESRDLLTTEQILEG